LAVLDRDVRGVVLAQKLGFVATVCPDGTPNLSPIVRKGYCFKGQATLHSDDEIYERGLALLVERGYDASPEPYGPSCWSRSSKRRRSSRRRMTEGPPRRSLRRAGNGTWRTS
jgi:hypothetical protein